MCIPIVLCCDEKYYISAKITIMSIIKHSDKSKHYQIYLLHDSLDESIVYSVTLLAQNNISIEAINIQDHLKGIDLYERGYFTKAMYYRILIPQIFADKDKIIYVDSDIIVRSDISQLYSIELGKNIIAGVIDICDEAQCQYVEQLGMSRDFYINSGILVFNVKQYIASSIQEKAFELIKENKNLRCPDQDAINMACKGKILLLDICWNFQWGGILSQKFKIIVNDSYKEEYLKTVGNIKILHFTTACKPWHYPKERFASEWWEFANKLPKNEVENFIKITKPKHRFKRLILFYIRKIIGDKNYIKLKKLLRRNN